jgi:DNA-binding NtrC family response regulator
VKILGGLEASISHAKVLLVDDDESIRSNLGRILGLHGFEVSTASNLTDALLVIASETFDVLLQ